MSTLLSTYFVFESKNAFSFLLVRTFSTYVHIGVKVQNVQRHDVENTIENADPTFRTSTNNRSNCQGCQTGFFLTRPQIG
jgi:hypothetical protein